MPSKETTPLEIVTALEQRLGTEKVRAGLEDRAARRHDYWFESQLDDYAGRGAPSPACVVRPASVEDVVTVVDTCRQSATPLVPYGLGSGVCGAVLVSSDAVVLDMGAMARVREVDPRNLLASFEAGVRGTDAEAAVAARGMTLGHYPQSIGVSSVGGWVATRAAGQFSTGYGNIEDIILDLEAVLPDGSVLQTRRTPRASAGPDLRHLLLGSEGTLGVITGVTISARRVAETRVCAAYYASDMHAGFEFQREIIQSGWQPVVMRQYDSTEAHRMFAAQARGSDCLLLFISEGPQSRVEAEVQAVALLAKNAGCDAAPSGAVVDWLAARNHVPTFGSFIENGVVVDTVEIAAMWSDIEAIYDNVVRALGAVPGVLAGSAHSSHVYRSGLNLYFTFAAQPSERANMKATYRECWTRIMEATAAGGGGVAHHHGIGRVRRDWLSKDIGDAGVEALRALKQSLDPAGFMNPGVMLPEHGR